MRQGACERIQRAERPDRPVRALPGSAQAEGQGRRRGYVHRYGLRTRTRVRYASYIRTRYGNRPSDNVHDQLPYHPGRPLLPADETEESLTSDIYEKRCTGFFRCIFFISYRLILSPARAVNMNSPPLRYVFISPSLRLNPRSGSR